MKKKFEREIRYPGCTIHRVHFSFQPSYDYDMTMIWLWHIYDDTYQPPGEVLGVITHNEFVDFYEVPSFEYLSSVELETRALK